ncbi:hypothetical protein TanjilG_25481 [Lupinus angustifolius]|uniref:Uncharacterized protein n=1 Tax=Lupinus angustifolius TaxID=3871 RepID=A0A4P1QTL7_LUPAN|nr:hypothetical protein TanjilG_25481 [Lupinus angustifolius]
MEFLVLAGVQLSVLVPSAGADAISLITDGIKNDKSMKTTRQPKYRPPGKDSPTSMNKGRSARGVPETAEKLGNMSVGTRRQSMGQRPPPMKTGVNWIPESRNFMLRPTQQIPTGRTFTRKVAG